jgi:ABC-type spermidine/putrescine transport system permease subunit I
MKRDRHLAWLAWPTLLYLAVFFLAPLWIVPSYSVLARDFAGGVLPELSLDAWSEAISPKTLEILGWSLSLALGVTALCLLAGYPCALAVGRLSQGSRQVVVLALVFPLITSQLLRVYGWMNLLPLEWRGNLAAVGFVLAVNYLPFMLLPLLRAWERLPPNVMQAALDLGATPWQTFWRVTWPLTRAGRWAGCALVFVPVCGEYLVPYFIGHGKVQVLGTLIAQEFEWRNLPLVAALAVWLLLLVAIPVIFSVLQSGKAAGTVVHRQEENSDA